MLILQILALENVVMSCILYPPCIYNSPTNRFCYLYWSLCGWRAKGREGKLNSSAKCKESAKCEGSAKRNIHCSWDLGGNACKDTIVFFILPNQLWNVCLSKLFIQNRATFKKVLTSYTVLLKWLTCVGLNLSKKYHWVKFFWRMNQ